MNHERKRAALALGVFLLTASAVGHGAPLTGTYENKNTTTEHGGASFTFPKISANVFAFHHFKVQVC